MLNIVRKKISPKKITLRLVLPPRQAPFQLVNSVQFKDDAPFQLLDSVQFKDSAPLQLLDSVQVKDDAPFQLLDSVPVKDVLRSSFWILYRSRMCSVPAYGF